MDVNPLIFIDKILIGCGVERKWMKVFLGLPWWREELHWLESCNRRSQEDHKWRPSVAGWGSTQSYRRTPEFLERPEVEDRGREGHNPVPPFYCWSPSRRNRACFGGYFWSNFTFWMRFLFWATPFDVSRNRSVKLHKNFCRIFSSRFLKVRISASQVL